MQENEERIRELQQIIDDLKRQLQEKEQLLFELKFRNDENKYTSELSTSEVSRYSRQMLLSELSLEGQIKMKKSKVLVIGAGGLGCPASLYLAAAGIGEITIIDNDEVELSNLHRQILHTQADIDAPKVVSVCNKLNSLNSQIKVTPLQMHANSDTLSAFIKKDMYNVILDCTDNVATRYLLNDICVLNNIPLVSGSALQFEGQLTVYNYLGGPCYRCLFPVPPPPETVTSCGDGGVIGAVPGTIGTLQALEAIKILTNMPGVLAGRMLTFDGSDCTFRNIKLRPRNVLCAVCGDTPSIKTLIDYEQFCGAKAHDKVENICILEKNEFVTPSDLFAKRSERILLDVRREVEYKMCSLPDSINFPYTDIVKSKNLDDLKQLILGKGGENVYVICRRGNDSQRAIADLKSKFVDLPLKFINVAGGLHSYAKHVDADFPVY